MKGRVRLELLPMGWVAGLYMLILRVLAWAVPDALEVEYMVAALDGKEEE